MANSVGSVSIDLEARIAKFESDLGRAARIAEQRSNEMRRTLGAVAGALGASLSIAGVTAFVKHALDAQDAISKMSQKVAVSTETLSGWQLAAKQAGVENDAFAKGLVKLSQSALMAVQNSKMQVDSFKAIGVSVTDSNGHLKAMDQLFPQVIDKLSKYRDSTAKTAVATQLFGRAGAELIPLINAGKEGLAEYIKMADDFGLIVGGKGAKAAEAFNDSLEQLSFVGKGVGNQLATALAPALADLAEKAVAFFRSGDWKKVLDDISTGAQHVADHVGDIMRAIKTLGEVVATVYATKMILWGTRWIGNLTAQSAAIAANGLAVKGWGASTAASFGNAIKNIGALGIAFNVLGSAVVGWQIGKYLRDQFLNVRLAGIALVDGLLVAWERIKQGGKIAFTAIAFAAAGSFDSIRDAFADLITAQAKVLMKLPGTALMAAPLLALSASMHSGKQDASAYSVAVAKITEETNKNIAAIHANTTGMADYEIAQEAAKNAAAKHIPVIAQQGHDLDVVNESASAAAKALDAYRKAQDALNAKAADAVAGYLGKGLAPDAQAWADYAGVIRTVAEAEGERITKAQEAQKAGVKGVDVAAVEADAQKHVADAIDQLNGKLRENLELAQKKVNFGQTMADDAIRDANIAAMSARDQAIARAGIAAANEALAQHRKLTDEDVQAQIRLAEQGAATAHDIEQYAQQQNQIAQEFAGFWENAASSIGRAFGDLVVSGLRKWSDFGRGLKSIAQQFISDIIAQFVRLRILGPLLSGAMTSVAGLLGITGSLASSPLQASANYLGNGATIGTAAGALGGGGGPSYAGFLQNGVGAFQAYKWASTGGIWGSAPASAPGMYGPYTSGYLGMQPGLGVAGPAGPYGGTLGGFSTFGLAGGALGAMWGLGRGSGGFSTAAATATGAIGGYAAGTAIATTISSGVAAGMTAIPVVGWVALAAMAIDQVSGGKLFGTKYQTAASDATLSLEPGGASAAASLYQTKQRALFGGRKTRVVDQAVSPEMQAAADALYGSIERTMVQGAQKLGVDVPAMIAASLNTHTTYNDKGQVRATEYVVNYLGQTWKEATAEAAAQRIGAEALVATVAASAGAVAQQIAEQWRKSADTLLDGAQTMLAAQADIAKGNSLIALGSTATLSQVIKFVQSMQADGEKLADTYNRLAQASAQYVQFVAQFAPVGTGFGASLQAIQKQMQANLDQANALAQAAGMQHAAESDLANIHQYAAKQAADAIVQLSAAAQDLAAKLYDVTGNSLTAVNAQIDKLQSKVQTAAQLAIGDNSPLSGKEKLDVALQGLRSGITSADDVLSLGRKLYASSADYAGLYAKVNEILQLPGAGGQQSLGDALTGYNQLVGQRDQLQKQADAMARFGDAKTLAQYVADISTTHGIGYGEAASGLGFSLNDLAKDLGLTNISAYLDTLQQQDVAGTTLTASGNIVDAVRGIGHDIVQAILGGPLVQPGKTTTTATTGPTADQAALLAKLSAQLDVIIGHTGTTAATNKTMATQGASDTLRGLAGSSRAAL